jgi:hypothetical protein
MRSATALVLVTVFGILLVGLNLGLFVERVAFNTDTFVTTVDGIRDDEAVQRVIANDVADGIIARIDTDQLAQSVVTDLRALAEDAGAGDVVPASRDGALLGALLERGLHQLLVEATLTGFEQGTFDDVFRTALRNAHQAVVRAIRDSDLLSVSGDEIVIDLRPIVVEVAGSIGGQNADDFVAQLDIPEDTGQIVVAQDSQLAGIWWFADTLDNAVTVLAIVVAVVAVVAIAVSPRRLGTLRHLAIAAVVGALLLLAAMPIVRHFSTSWVESGDPRAAAAAIYINVVHPLRQQSLMLATGGVILALVVTALLSARERAPGARRETPLELVRRNAGLLRVGGFTIAAAALLLEPQPGLARILSIALLLFAYLAVIELLASNARWARSSRDWLELHLRAPQGTDAVSRRLRAEEHRTWLRWAGIAAALVAIVLLAGTGTVVLATILVLALVYLAVVELSAPAEDVGTERTGGPATGAPSGPSDPAS